ncbi:MAG: hypothetical protein MUE73_08360 [Planctomycetes bacterium]|nr:hypothetical protein [Planctomycetota bacterium]
MSAFDLQQSLDRARKRLGAASERPFRAPRSDRGALRLDPRIVACVAGALSEQERPPVRALLDRIWRECRAAGLPPPSRATVYKLMDHLPTPSRRAGDLPAPVRAALYNLAPESLVPESRIVFYCLNHGDLRAASYAAGLPWLAIRQALRLPGWRERSRGLIEAIALVRRI